METLANPGTSESDKSWTVKFGVMTFGPLTTLLVGEYVVRHWPRFTEFQMVVSLSLMLFLIVLPLRAIRLARQRDLGPMQVAMAAYCCLMLFCLLVSRT